MPEKWKHIVCNNVHEKGEFVLKKNWPEMLIQKLFQPLVSNEYSKEKLHVEETKKL